MKKEQAWKPPKIWKGETVFIIGGGPSVKTVDLSLIHNRHVIGTNNAYGDAVDRGNGSVYYAPRHWVDICWFGDCQWWDEHHRWLKGFRGIKATVCERLADRSDVKVMCRGKPEGLECQPGFVSWNSNTGFSAINLAYHLGARTVVLIGFDMRMVDGETNYHRDHEKMGINHKRHSPDSAQKDYARFLRKQKMIAVDAKKLGIEIINATLGSAIEVFPITSLEDFLKNEK